MLPPIKYAAVGKQAELCSIVSAAEMGNEIHQPGQAELQAIKVQQEGGGEEEGEGGNVASQTCPSALSPFGRPALKKARGARIHLPWQRLLFTPPSARLHGHPLAVPCWANHCLPHHQRRGPILEVIHCSTCCMAWPE